MATIAPKSALSINCKLGFCLNVGDSLLSSAEGCAAVLNELLETHPSEFGRKDFALLNLLCAPSLRGSESLNIPRCLARLEGLTAFVKASTDRNLHRFRDNPDYGHCEPMWRMANLITSVKRDFGAAYNPDIRDNIVAEVTEPLVDSRDVFIHGVLDDDPQRRWGTCASIPVLVTAVARRLGYPVGLAVAGRHIYARWENGVCFDIEASNPMGMTVPSEEELREKIKRTRMGPNEEKGGYYLRTLFPAEEFALFLTLRVEALINSARYEDTLLWSARALQFAPDDPRFSQIAHYALDLAMKHRLRRMHPEIRIPPSGDPKPFFFNVGDLLRLEERALHTTIVAHYKEANGELGEARQFYEDACRQNFDGNNEHRDLQRFLRKHDLPRRRTPLLPPKNLGQPRRIMPACKPHQEAEALRRLADRFESADELVKARDALRDLYMFDPADTEVFQRARAIEERPRFQEQFEALVERQRRELERVGMLQSSNQGTHSRSDHVLQSHSRKMDDGRPGSIR